VCRYSPKKAKGFGMLQVDNDLKKIAKYGLFFSTDSVPQLNDVYPNSPFDSGVTLDFKSAFFSAIRPSKRMATQ